MSTMQHLQSLQHATSPDHISHALLQLQPRLRPLQSREASSELSSLRVSKLQSSLVQIGGSGSTGGGHNAVSSIDRGLRADSTGSGGSGFGDVHSNSGDSRSGASVAPPNWSQSTTRRMLREGEAQASWVAGTGLLPSPEL